MIETGNYIEQIRKRVYKNQKYIWIFLISRLFFGLIIIISGHSYLEILGYSDAQNYSAIAINGYYKDNLVAFFPLIPIIIRYLGANGLILINHICFYYSLKLLDDICHNKRVLYIFALSSMGFFSLLLYTECILCFLTLLAFWMYVKKEFNCILGIVIGLTVMTKSLGAMIFFAVFVGMMVLFIKGEIKFKAILSVFIPATLISLIYPAYLQINFGSWKYFIDIQFLEWGRHKENIIGVIATQLKIIFTNQYSHDNKLVQELFRVNEILSLLLFVIIIYLSAAGVARKETRKDLNHFVAAFFLIISVLSINSTVRNPVTASYTISNYRYYYALPMIYYLVNDEKTVVQKSMLYITIIIAMVTSFIFSIDLFFF